MLPGSGDCSACRGAAAPPTLPLSGRSLWARVVDLSVPIVVGSASANISGAARTTPLPPVSIPAFLAATARRRACFSARGAVLYTDLSARSCAGRGANLPAPPPAAARVIISRRHGRRPHRR